MSCSDSLTEVNKNIEILTFSIVSLQNFLEHYTKSKAPFPLFFHSAWFFSRPHRQEGDFKFLDSILALPDVYFVTSQVTTQYF